MLPERLNSRSLRLFQVRVFLLTFSPRGPQIKRKKSSIRTSRTDRTTLFIFFKTLNQYAYHPYYYLYISYGATITGRIFWHARASSVCHHLFFLMSFKFDLGVIPLRKIRRWFLKVESRRCIIFWFPREESVVVMFRYTHGKWFGPKFPFLIMAYFGLNYYFLSIAALLFKEQRGHVSLRARATLSFPLPQTSQSTKFTYPAFQAHTQPAKQTYYTTTHQCTTLSWQLGEWKRRGRSDLWTKRGNYW